MLVAVGGAAIPHEVRLMSDIKCRIQKEVTGGVVEFSGVVWSQTKESGSYRLFVKKEGLSGRSSMVQQGVFALNPNEKKVTGRVVMNLNRGDQIDAQLTITSGGKEVCAVEREE